MKNVTKLLIALAMGIQVAPVHAAQGHSITDALVYAQNPAKTATAVLATSSQLRNAATPWIMHEIEITPKTLDFFLEAPTAIWALHLKLRGINDDQLQRVSQCCPYLISLSLIHCDNITNAGLTHLASLPNLRTLLLWDCSNITNAGLAHLAASKALNIRIIKKGYTPDSQFWNDSCINDLAGVQAAIIAGANVNALNHGQSALHNAVRNENITIIQELLAAPRIDVNIRNNVNETPLHTAIYSQRPNVRAIVERPYSTDVIQLLLHNRGIDVNAQNSNLISPLIMAIENNQVEIVQMLLNTPGIDVNRAYYSQRTPLILAIENRNDAIIRILLADDGINVNAGDFIGETPLHKAIWHLVLHPRNDNDFNLIQALLNSPEINIEKASNNGMTPLMFASAFNKTEAVRLLLDHGANKNAVLPAGPYAGYTSLHYAAANGNKGIVQILLDAGADATIAASDGKTPEQMAILGNHPEIAELIKNHIERD